jgi:N-glycosidase YbiA
MVAFSMTIDPDLLDAPRAAIRFYSVTDEYGELSNFAPYPITLKGEDWPTTEHYFQAQKFIDVRDQEEIRSANTPMLAARWGRDQRRKLRRDWERVKLGVMRDAVEAKFRQHEDLRALLLGTGDAMLIEHTEDDDFWGDGGDGSGRNELGCILMAVRQRLREEQEA